MLKRNGSEKIINIASDILINVNKLSLIWNTSNYCAALLFSH